MILFGIRSPIVVEYEETCRRLGLDIHVGISVSGVPRSVMPRENVVQLDDFDAQEWRNAPFISCAFSPNRRASLIQQAEALGLTRATALIDPNAVLAERTQIGAATFVNAGVVIGAVTKIGSGVLINRAASVGHHCLVGDYTSIGPGATLAGNIMVGEATMIGVGATILPDIRIGAGAIVAGGSLVREDVPDGAFVAGNPAKPRAFDPAKSTLNVSGGE